MNKMERLRKILEDNYNLPRIIEINNSTARTSHPAQKIKTEKGDFFFKSTEKRDRRTLKNMETQGLIAEHLSKKGIPAIVPIKNKKGSYVTESDGRFYELFPFIEIDKPEIGDKYFDLAVETLAKFHRAMEDFKGKGFLTHPMHKATLDMTFFTKYDPRLKRKSVVKRAETKNTPFARKILDNKDFITSVISKVLKDFKRLPLERQTVLHYDFNKDNLFMKDGKLIAVSDFEYSHQGPVEADIAKAAKYWSENKKDASIDIGKFKEFIIKYSKLNHCSTDMKLYHSILLYIILRRLVYAADYTLEGFDKIEWLFDYDLKMIRFLMKNEDKFI